MTDDLVQQLKGRAAFLRDTGKVKSPDLMDEAAARIEALEAALQGCALALPVLANMCRTIGLPLGAQKAEDMLRSVNAALSTPEATRGEE